MSRPATGESTGVRPPLPAALLSALTVLLFLNVASRLTLGPLLPILEAEFDLRHGGAGALHTVVTVGFCTGLYASGYVAWRWSHRVAIAASAITLGTALLATAAAGSFAVMRIGLVGLGLGSGLYLPSGIATLTENVPETRWGQALAIHELAPNLAYIVAPLLTECLLGVVSWRGVLGALALPSIALGAMFLRVPMAKASHGQAPSAHTMAVLARDPTLWVIAALFGVALGVGLGVYVMLPLFLVNAAGMERLTANLVTGLTRVSGLISVLVSGALADRMGRKRMLTISLAGAGAATLLLALARGAWILPPLIFVQAAFAAAFYPAAFAVVSTVFPASRRNLAVSAVLILGALIGLGGVPPLIGLLADAHSFPLALGVIGTGTLASLLLLGCIPAQR